MKPTVLQAGEGRQLNVLGDNVLIRLAGKDTGGLFTLIEQANPAGAGIPLHVHDNEDELFEVLEGAVRFTVGSETVEVGAGATVLLPRGNPHSFIAIADGITRTHAMAFPSGIEHMFEELAALPPGPPDLERVFGICLRYGIRFLRPAEPAQDNLASV